MSKEIAKKNIKEIRDLAEINEAYLIGLLWGDPYENYSVYHNQISSSDFLHKVWAFHFELGKRLYLDGVKQFDDITVYAKTKELGIEKSFEEFGGKSTIDEAVEIVKGNELNIEYYYESLKKNSTIYSLIELFGSKVIVPNGKYDFNNMSRVQLMTYWMDKLNKINLESVNNYEVDNLYVSAEEFIEQSKENAGNMLKFYNSNLLNSITQGIPRGEITMIGGFGGAGKSSLTAEKVVMGCVDVGEKAMVVLNEEGAHSFRQKIVLSILNHEFHTRVDRAKMINGTMGEKDLANIHKAFDKMKELMDGDESLIKIIYMEKYDMDDLEKIVKHWANRGYSNLLIDTHKISDNYKTDKRWEAFVEDTKRIHKWTRAEAGGLNLRTVLTFQLADAHIGDRFLGFDAIGEGKMAKNEAGIVLMFRPLFGDEYEKLEVTKNVKMGNSWVKESVELDKEKTYYLLFVPKNRYGRTTDNGQPVLVMDVNFDFNSFREVGWTFVSRNYNGR